mgnify:CR=1 FL=1
MPRQISLFYRNERSYYANIIYCPNQGGIRACPGYYETLHWWVRLLRCGLFPQIRIFAYWFDDAEVVPLDDAATLLHKLFINLAYDFMEKNGHCTDYIEATDLEKYALRIWMKKYIDQLPEYRYILDDILSQ